eukprot:tig00000870_g5158.t1
MERDPTGLLTDQEVKRRAEKAGVSEEEIRRDFASRPEAAQKAASLHRADESALEEAEELRERAAHAHGPVLKSETERREHDARSGHSGAKLPFPSVEMAGRSKGSGAWAGDRLDLD